MTPEPGASAKSPVVKIAVGVAAILVLGVGGWFGYKKFADKPSTATLAPIVNPSQPQPANQAAPQLPPIPPQPTTSPSTQLPPIPSTPAPAPAATAQPSPGSQQSRKTSSQLPPIPPQPQQPPQKTTPQPVLPAQQQSAQTVVLQPAQPTTPATPTTQPTEVAKVTVPSPTPTPTPSTPRTPSSGVLTWTGRLDSNTPVTIDGGSASQGKLVGALPGVPISVEVQPAGVGIAEAPGPSNGWKRLVLRARKGQIESVTVRWQTR